MEDAKEKSRLLLEPLMGLVNDRGELELGENKAYHTMEVYPLGPSLPILDFAAPTGHAW